MIKTNKAALYLAKKHFEREGRAEQRERRIAFAVELAFVVIVLAVCIGVCVSPHGGL